MIKIEQLYVDLGPIPGNMYDQGTHTKSELKVVKGGFETESQISRLQYQLSAALLSTQNGTERTLSY